MEKTRVIFAKGHHFSSYMIRMRYQSRWSHCGFLVGYVVHEALKPQGVVKTPLSDFIARYGAERVEIAEANAEPGWQERAEEMLGVKYDFWGAVGMGFGTRRFDHPDKVWCSHHVGYVLGTWRPERLNRLSPEHIWMNTKAISQQGILCPG